MMLQTDVHNQNVKTKMTIDEFKKLAKGINDGLDLPLQFLEKVY